MLHICCAPDATVPLRELKAEGWRLAGFFYGSNIHPQDEYQKRLATLRGLRESELFFLIEAAYEPEAWFSQVKGLEDEPEGGRRCSACIKLQLQAAAKNALALGCSHLCTSLTISPHKDIAVVSQLGRDVCASHGLEWEDRIWRKQNGFLRSLALSRELGLYRQNYCGCTFSLRSGFDCPATT